MCMYSHPAGGGIASLPGSNFPLASIISYFLSKTSSPTLLPTRRFHFHPTQLISPRCHLRNVTGKEVNFLNNSSPRMPFHSLHPFQVLHFKNPTISLCLSLFLYLSLSLFFSLYSYQYIHPSLFLSSLSLSLWPLLFVSLRSQHCLKQNRSVQQNHQRVCEEHILHSLLTRVHRSLFHRWGAPSNSRTVQSAPSDINQIEPVRLELQKV